MLRQQTRREIVKLTGMTWDFYLSNYTQSSNEAMFSNFSQTVPATMEQTFKYINILGIFSFKEPHLDKNISPTLSIRDLPLVIVYG